MSYSNYQTSLWEEFKTPLIVVSGVILVLTGVHNTFYTWLSIDNKKVDVSWNVPTQSSPKEKVFQASNNDKNDFVASSVSAAQYARANRVEELPEASNEQPRQEKNKYVVIDGDVSVSASEFYHPRLTAAISGSDVSGYLEIESGAVKGLSVQINGDKTKNIGIQMITTGESELQGNIFVYDIEGQNYTATIYPTGPNEYMVSFVNGPWNGARVKFSTQSQREEQQDNQIINDDSYTAPEVDFVNREWASSDEQSRDEAVVSPDTGDMVMNADHDLD